MNYVPVEPTSEQCSAGDRVNGSPPAYACWYPQMGGYVGKCVAVFMPPTDTNDPDETLDYCFDAYVWHDGAFPFRGETSGPPVIVHHCMPSQFIGFGEFVLEKQKENQPH